MQLSLLTAFVTLFALPAVITAAFWLSPISRRYRTARWLLAPCIYLGVAALGLIVGTNLGWVKRIESRQAPQYDVTIEDWKSHPDVKEVRAIYDEIKYSIKEHNFKIKTRNFNIESPLCATYPVKSESLAIDSENRVRLYQVEQIISHREPLTIERYYDANGTLRFVFVDKLFANIRIYLNSAGNVVWAVEQSDNELAVYDASSEDWEMKPNNGMKAKEAFQAQQPCPEITK